MASNWKAKSYNKPWTAIYSLIIYSTLILFILPDSKYSCVANSTSSSTTKKARVRQREFLRGGDKPFTTTTTAATTSTISVVSANNVLSNETTTVCYDGPTTWRNPVIMESTSNHTWTVIFLHGMGDNGNVWAYNLAFVRIPNMKIICPTAQEKIVPFENGRSESMPSWFRKSTTGNDTYEDPTDLKVSVDYVHQLMDDEIAKGIPAKRIILGGYSQGAAVALQSAFSYKSKIGGIIAMSGWLPSGVNFFKSFNPVNINMPILQGHGDKDDIITFYIGNVTAQALKTLSNKFTFKIYPGANHQMPDKGLDDIKEFLRNCTSVK